MRIAAIQMTSTNDTRANLRQAHDLIQEAALNNKADLVALPETFSFIGSSPAEWLSGAERMQDNTVQSLREWAIEFNVWILAGSVALRGGPTAKRIRNTSLLFSNDGELVASYDKIHLFDADYPPESPTRESKVFQPGRRPIVAKTPFGKLGLSICYDLRFPELYRKLSSLGAEIIFTPAAFTEVTGKAHWDVLTRARAIENQTYLVAAAQHGSPSPGRPTFGHTRIIDPWGRVIAEKSQGPGVVWADIDFNEIKRIRQTLPALKNRRLK
ncbi:carbon-nitrogen hydrolase family protein [Bdellovibrionota bacterium FG-2]